MNISPELWQQIDPLLSEALDMEEGARASWLRRLDDTHPQLTPLLRKMLASHERAERSQELETVPKLAPAPPASSIFSGGTSIGPFELLRPLGRGGMGEVWLARQADGRVEREVALKLPTVYEHSDVWRERFRRERDILAKLVHPNIAQLYDAGVSEMEGSRGRPYLAMEYVEGNSLTEYVVRQRSTIEDRLKLFQQILAAVAHAHRHLVVHRDLKPANILIDKGGRVKLLDFGIAKLIDDASEIETRNLTRLGGRVMTLRYAAPEQVAEGAISTAIDVYALGVILHELLTGLSPYRAVRDGKPFTDAALLSADPGMPSSIAMSDGAAADRRLSSAKQLSRQILGDLDAIVLKAMRRNPADRYTSVDQFDDDIRRHLESRPVKARNGTWRYLAGRLMVRNKLPLATAAAVLVTMAAGLVMVERQRQVALAEKARAEKHFASVRKLANSFMFELQSEVATLPGSLKARQMLVSTSLQYLDSLSKEAGDDPVLRSELAAAYYKIANVQGEPGAANLGQLADSLKNFERAKTLYASLGSQYENNIGVQRDHLQTLQKLGMLYARNGDARWRENSEAALSLSARLALMKGAGVKERVYAAGIIGENAHFRNIMTGQSPQGDAMFDEAIVQLEKLAAEAPEEQNARSTLAVVLSRAATNLTGNRTTPQRMAKAIEFKRKALAIYAAMAGEFPDNRDFSDRYAVILTELASVLQQAGRIAEADEEIVRAVDQHRLRAASDPRNSQYRSALIDALGYAVSIAYDRGNIAETIRRGQDAQKQFREASPDLQRVLDVRSAMSEVNMYLGMALMSEAAAPGTATARQVVKLRDACSLIAASVAFVDELRALKPASLDETEVKKAVDSLAQCRARMAKIVARQAP